MGVPRPARDLCGTNADAVIEAIEMRHRKLASSDTSPDGRKLGLVIEGGALRAVASAGGAVVLAQLGFSNVFDEVYATSAAVMNASYFLSNQPLLGISVYFDNCTTRAFLNPLRFWKIIDVDYIFDHVAAREKPLDVEHVLNSRSTLHVAVLDRATGEAIMVNTKESRTPLLRVLKASAAIPVFYNRAVSVDGRQCMDGGLVIPFGIQHALRDGCTEVLVLSTRPRDYIGESPSLFSRVVFDLMCARGNPALSRAYAQKDQKLKAARDLALGVQAPPAGTSIATVCLDESESIHRMTTDRAELYRAATNYGRKVLRIFGRDDSGWSLPENCAAGERPVAHAGASGARGPAGADHA